VQVSPGDAFFEFSCDKSGSAASRNLAPIIQKPASVNLRAQNGLSMTEKRP
jgi:hypothetical protein